MTQNKLTDQLKTRVALSTLYKKRCFTMSFKVPCGGFKLDEESFSLDKNDVLSIPKPLTYDYMPEGYPKKTIGTVAVMAEQALEFALEEGTYVAHPNEAFEIVKGQTYIVTWDGADYECVCSVYFSTILALGNKSIYGAGDDTGEPFLYLSTGAFATLETTASHTISIKTIAETATPMAEEFLPIASGENYGVVKKDEIVTAYVFPNALAPQEQMNKAVDDFAAGKAKITWVSDTVLSASRSSDTEITIRLSGDPVNVYKYTANEVSHGYFKNNASEVVSSAIQIERIYLKNYGSALSGDILDPIIGVYNDYNDNYIKYGTTRIYKDGIAIKSSGSSKMFKISVNDSGTISATEVT